MGGVVLVAGKGWGSYIKAVQCGEKVVFLGGGLRHMGAAALFVWLMMCGKKRKQAACEARAPRGWVWGPPRQGNKRQVQISGHWCRVWCA